MATMFSTGCPDASPISRLRRRFGATTALATGIVAGLVSLAPLSAAAQTFNWLGTTADYGTAANWNPATVPGGGANDLARIVNAAPNGPVVSAAQSVQRVAIGGGNTLAVASGGSLAVGGSFIVGGTTNGTLTVAGGGAVTTPGNIVAGFSGANGAINVGTGGAAGAITANAVNVKTAGSSLNFNHIGATTFSATIGGAGLVTKTGAGTTTLTGINGYTGGTTIGAGTVAISQDRNLGGLAGPLNLAGGTLLVNANATLNAARAVTISAPSTINVQGFTTGVNGTVSGAGRLSTRGVGAIVLGGANGGFSGGIDVNVDGLDGRLRLNTSTAAGTGQIRTFGSTIDYANGITVANTIELNSASTVLRVLAGTATQGGVITEAGGSRPLRKTGTGTLVIANDGNNYSGATNIDAGRLTLTGRLYDGVPTGQINVAGLAGLSVTGVANANVTNAGTSDNAGLITGNVANSNTFANTGTVGGNLVNTGAATSTGTIGGTATNNAGTLDAQGTITGGVIVNAGQVRFTGPLALSGALTNNGTGRLTVQPGVAVTGVTTFTNNSTSANAVLIGAGGSVTATTAIANAAGRITNNGTLSAPAFTNAAGATLINATTGRVFATGPGPAGTLGNAGTLTTAGLVSAATSITNSGTLNAQGALTAPTVTNTGLFRLTGNLAGTTAVAGAPFAGPITNLNNGGAGLLRTNAFALTGVTNLTNAGTARVAVDAGGSIVAGGGLVNNSTLVNAVTVAAGSGITAASITNTAGGLINRGMLTTPTTTNAGLLANLGAGIITGNVANTGMLNNAAMIGGRVTNTGITNTTGTVTGGLDSNGGLVNASGTIGATITNNAASTFRVTGALTGNNSFTNNGTGAVNVLAGNAYTGSTSFTNNSTAMNAVSVGVGSALTSTGMIMNNAGRFGINGTITATATVNAAGAMLMNSGTGTVASTLGNAGMVGNAGTVTGAVTNMATGVLGNSGTLASTLGNAGMVNNSGVVGGAVTNTGTGAMLANSATGFLVSSLANSGTVNNAGLVGGAVTNTGVVNTTGTLAAGLTSTGGLVNASNIVNGVVANNAGSLLRVTGNLTGNNTLTNSTGSTLFVAGGNYTGITTLTNNATAQVSVAAGRTLQATRIVNVAGGSFFSSGNVFATGMSIVNAGSFQSTGVVSDASSITNLAGGTWQAAGALTAPVVTNSGTMTLIGNLSGTTTAPGAPFAGPIGAFNNTGAGELALGGFAFAGITNFTNSSTSQNGVTIGNGGSLTVTGAITNAGVLRASGAVVLNGNLVNTGTLTMLNGFAGDGVTIGGNFSGNGVVQVEFDASASRADTIRINSPGSSGSTSILVQRINTGVGLGPVQGDIGVISGAQGAQFVASNAQTPNSPSPFLGGGGQLISNPNSIVQYWFGETTPGSGQFVVRPDLNVQAASSFVASVSSALSSVNAFSEPASAFISGPSDPGPNTLSIGSWGRGRGGRFDTTAQSLVNSPNGVPRSFRNTNRTEFDGFQLGVDLGYYNINGTGWSANVGVHGGKVEARVRSRDTSIDLQQPFIGAYAAVRSPGGLSIDVLVRSDQFDLKLTSQAADLQGRKFKADGWSGLASVSQKFELSETIYIDPQIALLYSRADVDRLDLGGGSAVNWQPVESITGRIGMTIGTVLQPTQEIILNPFASLSFWHEFSGNTQAVGNFGSLTFPVSTDRIGTYAQASLGMAVSSVKPGLAGFVRADLRFGDRIDGYALNGGLRYQF